MSPEPEPKTPRGGRWRAVREYHPDLTDEEVDDLVHRAIRQEWELVVKKRLMNLDQARELTREELFPPRPSPEDEEETL